MSEHTCALAPVGKYSTIPTKCLACQDAEDPIVRLRAELEIARAVCDAGLALQEAKRNPNKRLAKPARQLEVEKRRDERDRALARYKLNKHGVELPRSKKLVRVTLRAYLMHGMQVVDIGLYSRRRGRVWCISKILPSDPTMIAMEYARHQVLGQAWRELRAAWRVR